MSLSVLVLYHQTYRRGLTYLSGIFRFCQIPLTAGTSSFVHAFFVPKKHPPYPQKETTKKGKNKKCRDKRENKKQNDISCHT